MFYRITADFPFTSENEARDFLHDCEVAILKTHTINPGQDDEERAHALWQKCYHDETPVLPCEVISEEWGPD